jgi:allantoicase
VERKARQARKAHVGFAAFAALFFQPERMTLATLNALDEDAAVRELRRCCGSSRWARAMAASRPFSSVTAIDLAADEAWQRLEVSDILDAFAAHPRIGAGAGEAGTSGTAGGAGSDGAPQWSSQEQAGARTASGDVSERLAAGNRAYEARFGYIFIICATGKSAGEMLASLEQRLAHTPDEELRIAAEEQRMITRLRLTKLLDHEQTGQ